MIPGDVPSRVGEQATGEYLTHREGEVKRIGDALRTRSLDDQGAPDRPSAALILRRPWV